MLRTIVWCICTGKKGICKKATFIQIKTIKFILFFYKSINESAI